MDTASGHGHRPLTRGMQIMLLAASVLVFLIGIPLVLLTTQTESYFAWTIGSALTAAFLGGAYWSSGVLELVASRENVWAHARVAVPAVRSCYLLARTCPSFHWSWRPSGPGA